MRPVIGNDGLGGEQHEPERGQQDAAHDDDATGDGHAQ